MVRDNSGRVESLHECICLFKINHFYFFANLWFCSSLDFAFMRKLIYFIFEDNICETRKVVIKK